MLKPQSVFEIPLYPITDRQLSGLSHAEQVRRLVAGGARVIQLREKIASPQEFYSDAREALLVARASSVKLIINDRVDIAKALTADGVHLGQDDLPPEAARRVLGNHVIIGFSTHNLHQALEAKRLQVDYIAVGPVFQTSTKAKPDPALGLNAFRKIHQALGGCNLVAIGGMSAETAAAVLDSGANAVAMIGGLIGSPDDITTRTAELIQALTNVPKM